MLNYQEFVIGTGGDYPDIDTFNAAFNNTFIPFPETTVVVCLVNEVHAWGQHITAPTNVRHLHVTVAGDNWHKGSKSIGCRIRADAHSSEYAALEISCISRSHTQFVTVEKLVIDANQQIGSSISLHGLNITSSINSSAYMQTAVDKCIFTAGGDVDCRGFLDEAQQATSTALVALEDEYAKQYNQKIAPLINAENTTAADWVLAIQQMATDFGS